MSEKPETSGIYVNPNLAQMERNEQFRLRQEMRKKRGGEDVVIRKGKRGN